MGKVKKTKKLQLTSSCSQRRVVQQKKNKHHRHTASVC